MTDYDPILTAKLIKGFKQGFDLGYRGYPDNNLNISNLTSSKDHPTVINKTISKELAAGRIVGPFKQLPFDNFQINPIGVVPKKSPGTFRMITNLSSPAGTSVNDNISDVFSNVSYTSFEEAIKIIISVGSQAFLAKTDIQSAFRLIPIHPNQYHILCFKWDDDFYYDRCLPMGARSSCQIFEEFSSALHFIMNKQKIRYLVHYLDDFLIVNTSFERCQSDLNLFLNISKSLGVPIATDKTCPPTQTIQFLGLEIDTLSETVRLPSDKLEKARLQISLFLKQKKCTLRDLQSLLGLLQFTCRVIIPGRAFLQNLYRLSAGYSKPFHKIRLTLNTKKDLEIWLQFLDHFNGISLYRDELFLSPSVVNIYTDASKTLGAGAVWGDNWFSISWPSDWWSAQNITFLELVPIVLAMEIWGPILKNHCIQLNTDNLSLAFVINKQSSKEHLVRILIRRLVLTALKHNILIKADHIPGHFNKLSDCLSRQQIALFFYLHPSANKTQSLVPPLPPKMN